jgi:hypothetical protein
MIVLFVHGMGRSPISGWPLLHHLRAAGLETTTFGYSTALRDFTAIKNRLIKKLTTVAARDNYIVVGHSLGGVLLRAAISDLPSQIKPPRHVFLLGSPVHASRLARRFSKNMLFRSLTGDCGELLASNKRMHRIGAVKVPTTSIIGVRGFNSKHSPFGDEPNDGVVALSEVKASWLSNQVPVPVVHTLLPASKQVANIILETIEGLE